MRADHRPRGIGRLRCLLFKAQRLAETKAAAELLRKIEYNLGFGRGGEGRSPRRAEAIQPTFPFSFRQQQKQQASHDVDRHQTLQCDLGLHRGATGNKRRLRRREWNR